MALSRHRQGRQGRVMRTAAERTQAGGANRWSADIGMAAGLRDLPLSARDATVIRIIINERVGALRNTDARRAAETAVEELFFGDTCPLTYTSNSGRTWEPDIVCETCRDRLGSTQLRAACGAKMLRIARG